MVYGLLALRPALTRKWLPLHGRHLCEPRLRPEEVADLRRTLLSMRPLQLRLVERRSSFRQLLEGARMSEALEGIADAELPLVILAERLGHTEPCAFSHVVRSYFVKAPSAPRHELVDSPLMGGKALAINSTVTPNPAKTIQLRGSASLRTNALEKDHAQQQHSPLSTH